jgi:uncharacterized protein (TIGR02271 family)
MTRRPDPRLEDTRPQPQQTAAETETLERIEERLVADVRPVEAGRVHLRKRVVEEREEVEVDLRHDELELERKSVDRPLDTGEKPIRNVGDTTVLLVVEERLEVRRVPWVVEEIHLRRRVVSEPQTVSDTVRKERWEMTTEGDIALEQR